MEVRSIQCDALKCEQRCEANVLGEVGGGWFQAHLTAVPRGRYPRTSRMTVHACSPEHFRVCVESTANAVIREAEAEAVREAAIEAKART